MRQRHLFAGRGHPTTPTRNHRAESGRATRERPKPVLGNPGEKGEHHCCCWVERLLWQTGPWLAREASSPTDTEPIHPYSSLQLSGLGWTRWTSRTRSTWSRDCATRRNTSRTARSDPRHLRRHRADPAAGHLASHLRPAHRVKLRFRLAGAGHDVRTVANRLGH